MKTLSIMKKITLMAMACFLASDIFAGAAEADGNRRDIDRLWNEYSQKQNNDLPESGLKILEKIRDKARSGRFSYDFYKAEKEYSRVSSSINWKLREQNERQMREELLSYGEPVLFYIEGIDLDLNDATDCIAFLEKWEKKLHGSVNSDVWNAYQFGYQWKTLSRHIGNDYRYVLLSMALRNTGGEGSDKFMQLIEKEYPEGYPVTALYELRRLNPEKAEGYDAFVSKYEGKAVSTLAKCKAISLKFNKLEEKNAGSAEYLELREGCRRLVSEKKGFRDEEKYILEDDSTPEDIIKKLEDKTFSATVRGSEIEVKVRNIHNIQVSVYAGEGLSERKVEKSKAVPVFSSTLTNGKNSFYAQDTLKATLPELADGEYLAIFKSDKLKGSTTVTRHSIALSTHRTADGWLLYAADKKSGKPVETAQLTVSTWNDDKLLEKKVDFKGATLLDSEIQKALKGVGGRCQIQCSYVDADGMERSSDKLSIYTACGDFPEEDASKIQWQANILCDRSAYRPGETLQFKSVIYKDFRNGKMSTAPKGTKVRASLLDAERNEVSSIELSTGEFGSVESVFTIPSGHRNGEWQLTISTDGKNTLNAKWFTVDEFKLPEFSASFEEDGLKHFLGERIEVRGRVFSYAGNSLSDALIEYTVSGWNGYKAGGKLEIEGDGSFCIPVDTEYGHDSHFSVVLKVTDGAGQTLEFSRWLSVSDDFSLSASLENGARGSFISSEEEEAVPYHWYRRYHPQGGTAIIGPDKAEIKAILSDSDGKDFKGEISWELFKGKRLLRKGKCSSGEKFTLDFAGLESGLYKVVFSKSLEYRVAGGQTKNAERTFSLELLKLADTDKTLGDEIENVFKAVHEDGKISFVMGAGKGDIWANVLIYDVDSHILANESVHLDGVPGKEGSLRRLSWTHKDEWSDRVLVFVEYFKDGKYRTWQHEYKREKKDVFSLPLSVTTFTDKCFSGTQYKVRLHIGNDAEALAAIFDKSTEDIRSNVWEAISPYTGAIYVSSDSDTGCDFEGTTGYWGDIIVGAGRRRLFKSSSVMASEDNLGANDVVYEESAMLDSAPMAPEAVEKSFKEKYDGSSDAGPAKVRKDFQQTLAFCPVLRSDRNGDVEFSFTTSDKLSTYILSVFAHDKSMRNAVLRREFIVSQPLAITVHEPSLLYGGDRYVFRPGISNNSGKDVEGTLTVFVYDGEIDSQAVSVQNCPLELSAGESLGKEFSVFVPDAASMKSYSRGKAMLSVKAVFRGKDREGVEIGDAVAVKIPVFDGKQVLTESHSVLYISGMDKSALVRSLEKQFVGTTHFGAVMSERSISEMVEDVLASKCGEPQSKNALDLSEVLFARLVKKDSDIEKNAKELTDCRCPDGGFAWFAGMTSSPVITAVLLERLAILRDRGLLPEGYDWNSIMTDAVKYIDAQMFKERKGYFWFGGLSIGEYIYVRSYFPEIAVDTKTVKKELGTKEYKSVMESLTGYLYPKASKGNLNGAILEKARRSAAILRLLSSDSKEFASSLGLKERKMKSTLSKAVASLKEYAVEHPSGGVYYPNAVMPFRAMLSSEAYAHSIICGFMSHWSAYCGGDSRAEEIADGVRLWLMVQKENQKWESNFEFINAVNSVLEGSPVLMQTSVISLSKTYEKPFEEIKAAGNGFSISRKFFVEDSGEKSGVRELKVGETLHVGQKVIARYSISSSENRSLVHIRTPYNACLRPVRQLSGSTGYQFSSWRINAALNGFSAWWVTPQGYREVHENAVDWWFDVYPEENTAIDDTFYVSQEGVFTAPVCEIESLYAPQYRANDGFGGKVTVLRQ